MFSFSLLMLICGGMAAFWIASTVLTIPAKPAVSKVCPTLALNAADRNTVSGWQLIRKCQAERFHFRCITNLRRSGMHLDELQFR